MKRVALVFIVALVAASCSSDGDDQKRAAAPARFEPGPCPKIPEPAPALATARCGFLVVPENRTKDNGRTIRVAVATIPAVSRTPAPDPVVYMAGGPGVPPIRFEAQPLV